MKLAFIILAHDDTENLFRLVERLLSEDDLVVVHWDKKNPFDILAAAHDRFTAKTRSRLRFARPVAVEWGRWSMVEATLSCLVELEQSVEVFDYVVLLSGADYPIKPVSTLKAFLAQSAGLEFIECVDPEISSWVVDGLVQERYHYYHWINWRDHPKLFSFVVSFQKKLGIKRKLPDQLKAHLGSQWWALTWPTLQMILQTGRGRKIRAFFARTWVPDELFFPTLVAALVPRERIVSRSLTFYHFSHQGRPLVFYNDHFDFLVKQGAFFARKLSPQATALRDRLDDFIDNVAVTVKPFKVLSKQLADYEHFIAVQWRGLPGRRIIGRQLDAWYGDLEWNKQAYFVILCYPGARLEPLRQVLNSLPDICCYGEVFRGGSIDYGLAGRELPLYPENKPALRDMKRPNFLCDLLHANHGHLVGFILRLPCGNEMEKMVIYDPQATLVFIFPEDRYLAANTINWQCAFEGMIMHDNLAEARRVGKQSLILITHDDALPAKSIAQAVAHLGSLSL